MPRNCLVVTPGPPDRDALGLPVELDLEGDNGEHVMILDAGRATLELSNPAQVAKTLAPPTRTPWNSLNARLEAPAELQITVFQELAGD